jgi:hypothetical protein
MFLLVDAGLIVLLAIVLFQDFRTRQISWYLIPLLLSLFIFKAFFLLSLSEITRNSLFNFIFILLQLLALTAYISFKKKKLTNIINTYIGIGDVLFFIVICLSFSPANFILFYVLSNVIILISFLAYNIITKKSSKEIPLAGGMAGVIILLIIFSHFIPQIAFYNDNNIISLFL